MSLLDDIYIHKRLSSVENTQESIQSLSLWALHHKTQHEKIVNSWLAIIKTGSLELRLHLFYLCNEMVQTCKRKNAELFKDSFKQVLRESIVCTRDLKIRSNIERILRIWKERNVYDSNFIDQLFDVLYNKTTKSAADDKLLAEFKPEMLFKSVKSCEKICKETKDKQNLLDLLPFDLNELQEKPRDNSIYDEKYLHQVLEMNNQLQVVVSSLESEAKNRRLLVELLQLSEDYYEDQFKDASIVVQAYKNFSNRINNLKLKLVDQRKLIPDPEPNVDSDSALKTSSIASVNDDDDNDSNSRKETDVCCFQSIIPKLESGFMTFLPKRIPSRDVVQLSTAIQSVADAGADGSSTPVQDEPPEPQQPPPQQPFVSFNNPMEFLTNLISQSTNYNTTSAPVVASAATLAENTITEKAVKKDDDEMLLSWSVDNIDDGSLSQHTEFVGTTSTSGLPVNSYQPIISHEMTAPPPPTDRHLVSYYGSIDESQSTNEESYYEGGYSISFEENRMTEEQMDEEYHHHHHQPPLPPPSHPFPIHSMTSNDIYLQTHQPQLHPSLSQIERMSFVDERSNSFSIRHPQMSNGYGMKSSSQFDHERTNFIDKRRQFRHDANFYRSQPYEQYHRSSTTQRFPRASFQKQSPF